MLDIKLKEIKDILSKIALGINKSDVNPSAGYIEIKTNDDGILNIKVSSNDYFLISPITVNSDESIHATILADKFINIISKLNKEFISLCSDDNSLMLKTNTSQYVFPIIKKNGVVATINEFEYNAEEYTNCVENEMNGTDLASISESNAQGLVEATFTKEIQQFIYVDNVGALTFTDNIYINNFDVAYANEFKILLNATQSRLLKIFDNAKNVTVKVMSSNNFDKNVVVKMTSDDISLSLLTQSVNKVNMFPQEKIRNLSLGDINRHVIINKNEFDKALSRLMVFDKKFDKAILDYSKLVFKSNHVELISVKNHNYEIIAYSSSENIDGDSAYEAIIRFGDLVNQLKAVTTPNVDISFGNGKAIVINSDIKQIVPEIKAKAK